VPVERILCPSPSADKSLGSSQTHFNQMHAGSKNLQLAKQITRYISKTVQHRLIHRVSKTSHRWIAITLTYMNGFDIFGRNVTDKVGCQRHFTMPPQVTCASALPGETGNLEFVSFHLNAACFLPKKTQNIIQNITWS